MNLDVDSVEMQIVYENTNKKELVILQKEEGCKSIPFEVWNKGKNGFANVHNLIQVVTSERGSSVSSSFKQAKKMQTVPENLEENSSNLNKRTRSIANQQKIKTGLQLEKSNYSKHQGNQKKRKIENIDNLSIEQTENNQPSLLQGQIFQGVQQYLLEKYDVDQSSKSENESENE